MGETDLSEETKKVEFSKKLSFFVVLLGVLAPAGQLIGVAFHQGTLSAYGVFPDSFPMSIQETYVTAYYAIGYLLLAVAIAASTLLKSAFTLKGALLVAITLIFILVFIYLRRKIVANRQRIFSLKLAERIRNIVSYLHWKNNVFTRTIGITGLASYLFLLILYFSMALVIFWLAVPYAAFLQGGNTAKEERDAYLQKGCFPEKKDIFTNCYSLKTHDGEKIVEGLLVAHSDNMIAFFTKEGSYVFKFPNGAVLSKSLTR